MCSHVLQEYNLKQCFSLCCPVSKRHCQLLCSPRSTLIC